jgi:hypothetical protein
MRTTVTLDDELLAKASEAMGISERSVLLSRPCKSSPARMNAHVFV